MGSNRPEGESIFSENDGPFHVRTRDMIITYLTCHMTWPDNPEKAAAYIATSHSLEARRIVESPPDDVDADEWACFIQDESENLAASLYGWDTFNISEILIESPSRTELLGEFRKSQEKQIVVGIMCDILLRLAVNHRHEYKTGPSLNKCALIMERVRGGGHFGTYSFSKYSWGKNVQQIKSLWKEYSSVVHLCFGLHCASQLGKKYDTEAFWDIVFSGAWIFYRFIEAEAKDTDSIYGVDLSALAKLPEYLPELEWLYDFKIERVEPLPSEWLEGLDHSKRER